MERLTKREIEVVRVLVSTTMPYRDVGQRLGLTHLSVEEYAHNVYQKVGVNSRDGLRHFVRTNIDWAGPLCERCQLAARTRKEFGKQPAA